MDDGGPRGRARSRSYSSDDHLFTAELDAAAGREPQAAPSSTADAVAAPGARSSAPRVPGLSQKTIQIMTRLDAATLGGVGAEPADGGSDGEYGRAAEPLDEEAAAEAELAEQERRRRCGESASVVGGGVSGAAARGGSGIDSSGSIAVSAQSSLAAGSRRRGADDRDYDVSVKLLILGDSGVGKTSLMLRFSDDKFATNLLSTAGVDYKTAFLDIEGKRVKCQIWDTAGQERFHVITHSYYKNAQGIVLAYDASDPSEESFNNVQYWMENIQKHAGPQTKKLLLGNKIDGKGKKIEHARGAAIAGSYGMKFFETSAKEGTNVRESFAALAREVIGDMLQQNAEASTAIGGAQAAKKKKDCAVM